MKAPYVYLLDTNAISDLVRHPQGSVARNIIRVGERAICTSVIVAAELRYGGRKKGSARLIRQLEQVLSYIEVVPLGEPADRHYGELRWHLQQEGRPIGPNDLLIAAHGLALGCTLVTANEREFARVPGLTIENWITAA